MRQHQRHEEDTGSERDRVRGFAKIKAADSIDEQIGDDNVEQTPEDIDQ